MKKIFVILIILILTGCTINVDVKIDDELKVDETINIEFNNDAASNYLSISDYAQNSINHYYNKIKEDDYSYKIAENKINSNVVFNRKTDSICQSISSNFSKELYNAINCTEDDNYIVISSEGIQKLSLPMNLKTFNVDNLVLNINLPVVAEDSNADYIIENVYTWKYDKSTSKDKKLYLKISKTELQKKLRTEKLNKIFSIGKVILIVAGIVSLILIVLYKLYKKNQIEY